MKYTDIEVLLSGYVSSSSDYFVNISFKDNGTTCFKTYCLTRGVLQNMPKYLITEIKRKIGLLIKGDYIVWHEYDASGNKRYDNLRYYDREFLLQIIKDW